MGKLYPPYIEGVLPACLYGVNSTIRVPFSMNMAVNPLEISGFQIKIKTISNNKELGVLNSNSYSTNEDFGFWAEFQTTEQIQLNMGQFYKIQMAYVDLQGKPGYYSTVGVIKATSAPKISIIGFEDKEINYLGKSEFIGEYFQDPKNGDYGEKVYSYCFNIYKNNNLNTPYLTSGVKIHNSSLDTSGNSSVDIYKVPDGFKETDTYQVEYVVTTINNLTYISPLYSFKKVGDIVPKNIFDLSAEVNYDNGYVEISVTTEKENSDLKVGQYAVCRSNETDAPGIWIDIHYFNIVNEISGLPRFKDTTVEHGKIYRYACYQFNDQNVVSSKFPANSETKEIGVEVQTYFEDAFIFDRDKYLKIKFNPKISSFKETVLEQKQDTIGSKYPFVFRNGNVKYKEFQISGLISYHMDLEQNFTSSVFCRDNEKRTQTAANETTSNFYPTTQLTDYNINNERQFRQQVLNWLNNGEIKCFKSPTEGAYVVRLMNVSLSPDDKLGRMLYTFQCTAYEIADYTIDNIYEKVFKTLLTSSNIVLPMVNSKRLYELEANKAYFAPNNSLMNNVSITSARPGTQIEVSAMGEGSSRIYFVNSSEELFLGDNITSITLLTDETLGQINYTYTTILKTSFDTKYNIYPEVVICNQFNGNDYSYKYTTNENNQIEIDYDASINIIDEIADKIKKELKRIIRMRFIKKEEEGLNYEFIIQYKQDGISFENKYDFSLSQEQLLHPLTDESELDTSGVLLLTPNESIKEAIFKDWENITGIYIGSGVDLEISYELMVTDYIEEIENCIDEHEAYEQAINNYKNHINSTISENEAETSYWLEIEGLINITNSSYNNLIEELEIIRSEGGNT